MSQNKKHLLSIAEYTQYEGISKKTVKRRIKNGEIPIVKIRGTEGYRRNHQEIKMHFSTLNKEAQKEFIQDRGLASKKKSDPIIAEDQQYLNRTQKQQSRFDENSTAVKTFLEAIQNLPPGRKTAFTQQFAKAHKISESKLRRVYASYYVVNCM